MCHYYSLRFLKEEEEEDSSPGVSFSLSSEESEMEPEEERIRYSQRLVSTFFLACHIWCWSSGN